MSEHQRAAEFDHLRKRFAQSTADALTCIDNAEQAVLWLRPVASDGVVSLDSGEEDDVLVHLAQATRALRAARAIHATECTLLREPR